MRKLLAVIGLGLALAACSPAQTAQFYNKPVEQVTPQDQVNAWNIFIDNIIHPQPFLVCVRQHESDRSDRNQNGLHDAGYEATNGQYRGAYQFDQGTWNNAAANYANRPHLVGVDPATVDYHDQDWVAWTLYQNYGSSPWNGSGCY